MFGVLSLNHSGHLVLLQMAPKLAILSFPCPSFPYPYVFFCLVSSVIIIFFCIHRLLYPAVGAVWLMYRYVQVSFHIYFSISNLIKLQFLFFLWWFWLFRFTLFPVLNRLRPEIGFAKVITTLLQVTFPLVFLMFWNWDTQPLPFFSRRLQIVSLNFNHFV